MKLVLASGNAGKIREFEKLLAPLNWEIIPQKQLGVEDADETGLSFVENAILKARHAAAFTKLPAIADDSGIVVDALNGTPGIYSARYAGEHGNAVANYEKLLAYLKDVPDEKRTAHFYCALVFMRHENDPAPIICIGKWDGFILHKPKGTGGHGYDPVFFDPKMQQSAAELSLEDKNNISHRGQALQQLLKALPDECTIS